MKTSVMLPCFAVVLLATSFVRAADLTVKVSDVRSDKGLIKLAVFDSAEGWNGKSKAVAGQGAAAHEGSLSFHFKDLAPGTYAISVMHDENNNDTLDSNFMGMPIEGYGFSNDPQVMRKATFEEASFTVDAKDTTIELHLR